MTQEEKGVTPFGTVTSDHLIYNVDRGWFREGSPENIPLRQVTSVKLETRRNPVFGILLVLVALACRAMGPIGIVVAIVPLAFAILLIWGSPLVKVNTIHGTLRLAGGPPWTRPEAEWFAAAVDRHRIVDASQAHSTGDRRYPLRSGTQPLPRSPV
jgi:hypothetical protein